MELKGKAVLVAGGTAGIDVKAPNNFWPMEPM